MVDISVNGKVRPKEEGPSILFDIDLDMGLTLTWIHLLQNLLATPSESPNSPPWQAACPSSLEVEQFESKDRIDLSSENIF